MAECHAQNGGDVSGAYFQLEGQAGFLPFPLGWFLLVLVAAAASWYMWQDELPAFWWLRVTEGLEVERTSKTSSTNPRHRDATH